MGIHPKRVSSTTGSAGFPILGVVSVLILAYSLVPRIRWAGSSFFKSTSSISTSLRWSYSAKMSLYQGLVRVSGTPRFTFVISVHGRIISREVFNHHIMDFDLFVCCLHEHFNISELFRTGCLPIRSSKAAEAYELPAPVASNVQHQILQTSNDNQRVGHTAFASGV